jgi:hypothetical protein
MRLLFGILSMIACSSEALLAEETSHAQAKRIDEYRAVISAIAEPDTRIHDLPGDIRIAIDRWTRDT